MCRSSFFSSLFAIVLLSCVKLICEHTHLHLLVRSKYKRISYEWFVYLPYLLSAEYSFILVIVRKETQIRYLIFNIHLVKLLIGQLYYLVTSAKVCEYLINLKRTYDNISVGCVSIE